MSHIKLPGASDNELSKAMDAAYSATSPYLAKPRRSYEKSVEDIRRKERERIAALVHACADRDEKQGVSWLVVKTQRALANLIRDHWA